MLAKVLTCAVVGLEGALVEVEVEVDIGPGLPAFNMVGLPDASVQEAKERVREAVKNSGCVFPQRRITVNLAPADLKKEGPTSPTATPQIAPSTCRPMARSRLAAVLRGTSVAQASPLSSHSTAIPRESASQRGT